MKCPQCNVSYLGWKNFFGGGGGLGAQLKLVYGRLFSPWPSDSLYACMHLLINLAIFLPWRQLLKLCDQYEFQQFSPQPQVSSEFQQKLLFETLKSETVGLLEKCGLLLQNQIHFDIIFSFCKRFWCIFSQVCGEGCSGFELILSCSGFIYFFLPAYIM